MVFCIGLATLKYQEGLVVVGMEGGAVPYLFLVDRIDSLARDCRTESCRILDTHAQKNTTCSNRLVQPQLGA